MTDNDPPHVFIQYKNTDICIDFYCECGAHCHFDGYFAYQVRCPHCGVVWSLPSVLPVKRTSEVTDFHDELACTVHGFNATGVGASPVDLEPDEDLVLP